MIRGTLSFCAAVLFALTRTSAQEDISEELAAFTKHKNVPAITAAAVKDGEIVSLGSFGLRNANETIMVGMLDRFHVGSIGKSMTATLGAILIEEGHLSWDSTIGEVLDSPDIHPEFREVTFRQLVTHTGGVMPRMPDLFRARMHRGDLPPHQIRREIALKALMAKPNYTPGTEHRYSNLGYMVAGAMIDKVMNRSFENLIQERLFRPLQMKNSHLGAPIEFNTLTQPVGHLLDGGFLVPVNVPAVADNPKAMSPAGCFSCTIEDLAKYALFHLGDHGADLISEGSRRLLYKAPKASPDYACGWIATEFAWGGGKVLWHNGSNTMFHALVFIAPERSFAAVVISNSGTAEAEQACHAAVDLLIKRHLSHKL